MKKILFSLLAVLLIVSCLPVCSFAENDDREYYNFELYENDEPVTNNEFNDEELFPEQTDPDFLDPGTGEFIPDTFENTVQPDLTNVFEITEPASTGEDAIPKERLLPRLVDAAGIIDDSDEADLLERLNTISEKNKIDVAIVTSSELHGKDPGEFADDYYDYNGFGFGSKRSGFVLLISMNPRYVYISTCGKGEKIISDVDPVIDTFYDEIVNGDYYTACKFFTLTAEKQIKTYKNIPVYLAFFALAIGFIFACIKVSSLKSKHKTVKQQNTAVDYIVPGSLLVTASNDIFVDKFVRSTPRAASTSSRSSGSSGGHVSSSGSHHGGGGRSF